MEIFSDLDEQTRMRQIKINLIAVLEGKIVDVPSLAPQGKENEILQQSAAIGGEGKSHGADQTCVDGVYLFWSNLLPLYRVTPMPGSGTTKDENGVVAIKGESR